MLLKKPRTQNERSVPAAMVRLLALLSLEIRPSVGDSNVSSLWYGFVGVADVHAELQRRIPWLYETDVLAAWFKELVKRETVGVSRPSPSFFWSLLKPVQGPQGDIDDSPLAAALIPLGPGMPVATPEEVELAKRTNRLARQLVSAPRISPALRESLRNAFRGLGFEL